MVVNPATQTPTKTTSPTTDTSGSKLAQAAGNAINANDFMKLLLAQITSQNPLQPMSQSDMMQQMVGMQSVNSMNQLTSSIQQMNQAQSQNAAQLIGRTVTLVDPANTGAPITGKVDSIKIQNGQASLVVGGNSYSTAWLTQVQ